MSMEKSLKEILDEILDEVQKELDEATTTGNVAGYQTPHAFSDKKGKDKKRKKKIATQMGYSVVGDDVNNINEASDSEIKKSIKKNSKGGPYSVVVQKGNMSKHISHAKDVGNDINKVIKVYNQFKKKHRAGVQIIDGYGKTVFFESINEAKAKRPVNRWLELKNDESMHPHKKMAMGLKELKYQLREVEKFFNWYNKIKTINELDSDKYWKRTNRHIYTIKEKLIKIAKTIQEIEK
jgi:hypothetical protein